MKLDVELLPLGETQRSKAASAISAAAMEYLAAMQITSRRASKRLIETSPLSSLKTEKKIALMTD
ncbi:hypothetical protein [Caulobacter vibrioides]|uniref:hypothetical protein n=1 Tax=Caulobacter vibrioides TaxID=155892 RepID=UPI000F7492CB|nr:hypothetical protein [Caulobacter vibrioides]